MSEFSVSNLTQGAIQYLYSIRDQIWLDPPYQRLSDIWPKDKRQLLVDSVINGYDIPKLYFHELVSPRKAGKKFQKYAIIDGKQRLESLWAFMEGRFALAEDFEYLADKSTNLGGLTYLDIGEKYPLIKSRFDGTSLAVVAVRTDDIDLIEDMFSRLNEAVPLNAPEKRNALGGPLPPEIRKLSQNSFFSTKLPFKDKRYRHRDLATKFLLIEAEDRITDTKKIYLDEFVRAWADDKKRTSHQAADLSSKVQKHLGHMSRLFTDEDPLLGSIGMTLLIFHFFRFLDKVGYVKNIRRDHFDLFENARRDNRQMAEEDITKAKYDLLEFDKYVQSPNDAYATRIRLSILVKFMREQAKIELPTAHAYLNEV
jgi:hypothetical protein